MADNAPTGANSDIQLLELRHKHKRTPVPGVEARCSGTTAQGSKSVESGNCDMYVKDKKRMMRNVLIVSMAWVFQFTAFQALTNLQSSINQEHGLGTAGLATLYASLIVSCLFLPPTLISKLGCKWTIAVSMIGYIIYTVANFYPTFGTIIPASVIIGLCAAPLWGAKCTYLTELGIDYAQMSGETMETVVTRFFGIFFMFFQSSQIWGNLLSSTILYGSRGNSTPCGRQMCGAQYFESSSSGAIIKTDREKVIILISVYTGCCAIAIAIIVFMMDKIRIHNHGNAAQFDFKTILATFLQMKNRYQIIIIPLTIYSGMEQAFIASEFTKAFVSCTVGVWFVGYVMMAYGVMDASCSFIFGKLVKQVGRIPFFLTGACAHFALQITMMLWSPDACEEARFDLRMGLFLIAAFWGIGDAIWQTQINAFYGVVFVDNQEAAFANYRLWESMGFIIGFSYSSYFTIPVKLGILMGVLFFGMIGYLFIEYDLLKTRRQIAITETKSEGN